MASRVDIQNDGTLVVPNASTINIVGAGAVTETSAGVAQVTALGTNAVFGNDTGGTLGDGLVHAWTGRDGYYHLDYAGGGMHLIQGATANPVLSTSSGKIGSAMTFDGSGWLYHPDIDRFPSGASQDWSLSLWVNLASTASNQFLFGKSNFSSGTGRAVELEFINGSGFRFLLNTTTPNQYFDAHAASVSTSTWYHVVVTVDADSQFGLWVDGTEETTSIADGAGTADNAHDFTIGAAGDGPTNSDKIANGGLLEQVLIYNRVLTDTEVADLYNGGDGSGLTLSLVGTNT